MALRITEIFYSLQGEASRVGLPTVFVRLTGCPLRCTWCDTTYSFTGGEAASIASVLAQLAKYPARQNDDSAEASNSNLPPPAASYPPLESR